MIEVTLITNNGAGLPCRIPVVENTTLEKFLELSFEGNPDDFTIRVRANGTTVQTHRDYVLQDGDRISMAPTKVDGAIKTAVFSDGTTVIVVGLDRTDNPIDTDGTLFGPESGRDIEEFDRDDFDPSSGEVVIVEPRSSLRVV